MIVPTPRRKRTVGSQAKTKLPTGGDSNKLARRNARLSPVVRAPPDECSVLTDTQAESRTSGDSAKSPGRHGCLSEAVISPADECAVGSYRKAVVIACRNGPKRTAGGRAKNIPPLHKRVILPQTDKVAPSGIQAPKRPDGGIPGGDPH